MGRGCELPSPCGAVLSSRWFVFGLRVEVSSGVNLSLLATQKLTRNLGVGSHLKAGSCIGRQWFSNCREHQSPRSWVLLVQIHRAPEFSFLASSWVLLLLQGPSLRTCAVG